jgi:uracil-DNA glycosylase family 4
MLHDIQTIRDMNRELSFRAQAGGLQFDCGCGGNFNAEIVVIAEAPGEREAQTHLPLIGSSGKLLWDVLRREGITRNDVYSTNVVKRKLVGISEGHEKPHDAKKAITKQELSQWRDILYDELSYLSRAKVLVLLGNFALEAITGETGILKWRGSVFPKTIFGRSYTIVCATNPAHILRTPKLEIVYKHDMHKITRALRGEINPPPINTIINPTYEEAIEYINHCRYSGKPISIDIETMGGETACFGLAIDPYEAMCIPFRNVVENIYPLHQEIDIRVAIQELVGDGTVQFVAQNGHFDVSWLWYKDRIRTHGIWHDTMLAHHAIYPSLPHNLGFITSQYTDYPYYKDELEEWKDNGTIDDFWRYNGKDCCITLQASTQLHHELESEGLTDFFYNHVMRVQRQLNRMTACGVKIDERRKAQFIHDFGASVETAKAVCIAKAQEALGAPDYTFNPQSWAQLAELFFDKLGLVGRGRSTDKDNRDRIKSHPRTNKACRDLLDAVDFYLEQSKFFSSYANASTDPDGRFRSEWNQRGVVTAPGRLSSSKNWWGTGLNQQTIPDRGKPMFIADPGYEFTYFDKSQIEARIVAWRAPIPKWIEQFERARLEPGSFDAHRALASEMWGVPYDDVPTQDFDAEHRPTMRYVAKRCRHGLNYRMGPDRLATTAGLSLSAASTAYQVYHRTTPEVMGSWDDTLNEVYTFRKLITPYGRLWRLIERWEDANLDSIIAFYPQSTNGDHVQSIQYLAECDPEWPTDARVVLNNHDALITLNRVCDGPLVRRILKHHNEKPILIRPLRVNGKYQHDADPTPVICPAEFGVSQPDEEGIHRWSTIKKLK